MPNRPAMHRPKAIASSPRPPEQRPTAAQRGYGSRWQRYRLIFLREHTLCVRCEAEGRVTAAEHVDHVSPVTGADDPLFWEEDNHQALCASCHARKTQSEDRHRGRKAGVHQGQVVGKATIVCGPPGSGKTAYVQSRKSWNDLVIDLDMIWQALTGLPYYDKPEGLLPYVMAARDAAIDRAAVDPPLGHTWVICGGAKASEREQLAARLNADVVILDVGLTECMSRIQRDERRKQRAELWMPLVQKWWDQYRLSERREA